jgi:hypothetical protein
MTTIFDMGGEDDHVHLLVESPPKLAVSNLVNSLKSVSSRLLRKERPDIQMWWRTNLHPAPVHRAAADTALRCTEINPKDGSAVRAILPRPERRGLPRNWSAATSASLLMLGQPGASGRIRARPHAGHDFLLASGSGSLPKHAWFALLQLRARAECLRTRSARLLQAWCHVLGFAQHYGGKGIAKALRLPPAALPSWLASPKAIRGWTDRLAPRDRAARTTWLIEGRKAFLFGAQLLTILTTAANMDPRQADQRDAA